MVTRKGHVFNMHIVSPYCVLGTFLGDRHTEGMDEV